jgi:hypothetical protein
MSGCLYLCMYLCLSVCIYVCMYVCIYLFIYVWLSVFMYVCMYLCLALCIYVCMYLFIYLCLAVCIYVCMYVSRCDGDQITFAVIISNKISLIVPNASQDSSVGTENCYGLDVKGIEFWWDRDFPHPSGPNLDPTQPPVQCIPRLFHEGVNR